MTHDDDPTATEDELGIFINSEGQYRILIPKAWEVNDNGMMPGLAYLTVAALLRLAMADETEFARALSAWAERQLRRPNGDSLDLIAPPKKPRH